jgi:hypothetical protein
MGHDQAKIANISTRFGWNPTMTESHGMVARIVSWERWPNNPWFAQM